MGLRGKSMTMRKSRRMHRKRSMGMSKRRTMRRSRMMRGGNIANAGTITGSSAADLEAQDVTKSLLSGEGPAVTQGYNPPEFNPNVPLNPDEPMSGGRRRRRRSMKMRGGEDMALPSVGAQRAMYDGGKRRSQRKSRRGGSLVATAAVPFGLWGLQRYFSGNSGSSEGDKHHRRRRHRRS